MSEINYSSKKQSQNNRWYRSIMRPVLCYPYMDYGKKYFLKYDELEKIYFGKECEAEPTHFVIPIYNFQNSKTELMIVSARNDLQAFFEHYEKDYIYKFSMDENKKAKIRKSKKKRNSPDPDAEEIEKLFNEIPASSCIEFGDDII